MQQVSSEDLVKSLFDKYKGSLIKPLIFIDEYDYQKSTRSFTPYNGKL